MDEPNQEKIEEEIDKEIVPINETIQNDNWQLNNNNMQKEYDPQGTDAQAIDAMTTACSGRHVKLPIRFCMTNNVHINFHVDYGYQMAKVIAKHMCAFNEMNQNISQKHHSFIQVYYTLGAGRKKLDTKVIKLQSTR